MGGDFGCGGLHISDSGCNRGNKGSSAGKVSSFDVLNFVSNLFSVFCVTVHATSARSL